MNLFQLLPKEIQLIIFKELEKDPETHPFQYICVCKYWYHFIKENIGFRFYIISDKPCFINRFYSKFLRFFIKENKQSDIDNAIKFYNERKEKIQSIFNREWNIPCDITFEKLYSIFIKGLNEKELNTVVWPFCCIHFYFPLLYINIFNSGTGIMNANYQWHSMIGFFTIKWIYRIVARELTFIHSSQQIQIVKNHLDSFLYGNISYLMDSKLSRIGLLGKSISDKRNEIYFGGIKHGCEDKFVIILK